MFERSVSDGDVRHVISTGQTIEEYPDDRPFPSRLILGFIGSRPLHVVLAYNQSDDSEVVVTVYEPDPARWDPSYRRRLGQ